MGRIHGRKGIEVTYLVGYVEHVIEVFLAGSSNYSHDISMCELQDLLWLTLGLFIVSFLP